MKSLKTCSIVLLVVFIVLISFGVRAEDKKQYCVSESENSRVTIQCEDGTVSVTTYNKFVVCTKSLSGEMSCQEKDL